jgi:molybdate transport system substrate-binding protein
MRNAILRRLFRALTYVAMLGFGAGVAVAQDSVTVFAAASLKPAMDEIAARYRQTGGGRARLVYGGSSALARQIEYGAPAQIFISANSAWMDLLAAEGLLATGSRRDLLSNRLVLIGAPGFATGLRIGPGFDLAGALAGERLSMALVDAVPAGQYGRAALQSLGVWEAVKPLVAQAGNVTAALLRVALGEAPMGIVYATDAAAEPRVWVIATFPEGSHPPIRYPVAIVKEGDTPGARALLGYLTGPEARAVFDRRGFGPPSGGP